MDMVIRILRIVYVLVCLLIIALVLIQKSDRGGASETIMGSGASNFYEKNKGRTREGKLKRNTIILAVVFAVLTIALSILGIR